MQPAASSSPSVQRLPADVAHQLRARTILFSPSQAVHELVANALDAEATRVEVVMDCTRMMFTMRDNGRGMARSDLEVFGTTAHSTSKCIPAAASNEDTGDVLGAASSRTHGWRGEAISSIARLARIDVETRKGESGNKRRKVHHENTDPRAFVFQDDETYTKSIQHGQLASFGFSSTQREAPGTTITISELYQTVPVRHAMMMQQEERQLERERIQQVMVRLALIHPHVDFQLFDATLTTASALSSPQPAAARRSSSAAFDPSSALSPTHLPARSFQRIWTKAPTASMLENFLIATSGESSGRSPALTLSSPVSKKTSKLVSNLFELPPFTPACGFSAAVEYVSSMRASGFFADPSRLHLLHREHQYVYVNRHGVVYKPLQQALDHMYARLEEALGSSSAAEADKEHQSPQLSTTNKLHRGSLKQKSAFAPSSKQGRRRHPAYLLHIQLPPPHYDLLFDPQKTTVEFQCSWAITEGLVQGIEAWLRQQVEQSRTASSSNIAPASPLLSLSPSHAAPTATRLRPPLSPSPRLLSSMQPPSSPTPAAVPSRSCFAASPQLAASPRATVPSSPKCSPKFSPKMVSPRWRSSTTREQPDSSAAAPSSGIQLTKDDLLSLNLVGQVGNQIIIAQSGDRLLAVDQHAADERRRLEYLHRNVKKFLSQRVLERSIVISLSSTEMSSLQRHTAELNQWSWRFRASTSSLSVSLLAIPLVCGVELDWDDLHEHLVQLHSRPVLNDSAKQLRRLPAPVHRILNYKSCRSSVMFGDALAESTMRNILRDLAICDLPWNCAHGRPTMTPVCELPRAEASDDAGWTPSQQMELRELLTLPAL
jgi:DNA mismatch repair protein MutL